MPLVRKVPEGEAYQPQAGERLLQLVNTGDTPLSIGIRRGEYMIATAAGDTEQPTYVLTEEQWVRLQQQLQMQATYKNWLATGLLTLREVPEVIVPPPEPEPPPERSEDDQTPTPDCPTPDTDPHPEQPKRKW